MKKYTVLLLAVIMLLSLSACGGSRDNPAHSTEVSDEAESSVPAGKVLSITYYRGNDNADGFVEETAEVSELSAQEIVNLLSAKGIIAENVTVNSFSQEGSALALDLSTEFQTGIQSMGTAGEYIMLGSLVNTFLTCFEADSLELTVAGECLATGHNIYDYILEFF